MPKNIYILAGPNGVGKTTFAKVLLPDVLQLHDFVNADLIAAGLSPFAPEKESVKAGKLMLKQIDKLVEQGQSFCLETTLSGRGYLPKIAKWQSLGYKVHLFFLSLPDADMAINRVSKRVVQGGHYIPDDVVRRRFVAGLKNFHELYKGKVNTWMFFDNSGERAILLNEGENNV